MKTLLFIVDMQNDFCSPQGALYVPNAEADVDNLVAFIQKNSAQIDGVVLTQDSHHVLDISHPSFWMDAQGHSPAPFTGISSQDIALGRWMPRFEADRVRMYIEQLELQGEYPHTIWPEHCLIGSQGAAFVPALMDALATWARNGRYYSVFAKGANPLTEHFGALRANIPLEDAPETCLNQSLLAELMRYDRIVVAGEAKSHCVANTISQMADFPSVISKTILLADCTSNVPSFETIADPIYQKAHALGMVSVLSNDLTL